MLLVKGKKMEKTKCSICEEIIIPDPGGWNGGHNAEPVAKGKCCGACNEIVIIRRLNDFQLRRNKNGIL